MKSFAALLLLGAATLITSDAFAQAATNPDPAVNVRDSRNYESMVDSNAGFRTNRMRQECDPIQADDLRRQCIESFRTTPASSGASGTQPRTLRPTGQGTR
jgi:hypothetical protein